MIAEDDAGKAPQGEPDAGNNLGSPVAWDVEHWPTGRLLSTAARLAKNAWTKNLRAADLTQAGYVCLDVLAFTGPLTPSRLARIVHVQAQTIGRILGRLERHGHVTRQRDPNDRRVTLITITQAGRDALSHAYESEQQTLTAAHGDIDTLRQHLITLVRELTNKRKSGPGDDPSATW